MTDTIEASGIAEFGALIAHPARAAMLTALLGGTQRPAGDLARAAWVSPQSASAHLARLVDGGLLAVEARGRHRYYHIASAEVASAIEAVSASLPQSSRPAHEVSGAPQQLRDARTCYDHLAGRLGIAVTDALVASDALRLADRMFTLTEAGEARLRDAGIDVDAARASKRRFAPACLDWTERRYHLAGALGAALCSHALAERWVVRVPGDRGLRVTVEGARALWTCFSVRLD
jgi:DNA-binding transcriptional ArsR family regulator